MDIVWIQKELRNYMSLYMADDKNLFQIGLEMRIPNREFSTKRLPNGDILLISILGDWDG